MISDPRVFQCLIVSEKLFQWCGKILVCCQHCDKRPEADAALDYKIAPQRIEQEWRECGQKVVQRLDEKLQNIDTSPNLFQLSKAGECWRKPRRATHVSKLITEVSAQIPDLLDPCPRISVYTALQLGQ